MGKWQSSIQRGAARSAFDDGVRAYNRGDPKTYCMIAPHLPDYHDWIEGWAYAEQLAKKRETAEAGK